MRDMLAPSGVVVGPTLDTMQLINRLVVTTLPLVPRFLVGRIARRYVAGENLDEAVAKVRDLNQKGAMVTLDLLGESVSDLDQADEAVAEYLRILDRIRDEKLDANVSLKPTQLGLLIDEAACQDKISRVVERAAQFDSFVRIDMEDRTTTDATLRTYHNLHRRFGDGVHGHVGVVLQAYMRRTLADIAALPTKLANVRLCKGIYIEPRADAWKGYDTVRHAFLSALEKLLRQGVYVGIATHDEFLTCGAITLLDRLGISRDRYEFQMLLGVDTQLRDILIQSGHRLRVYVPYGRDWYQYSTRRLRENPEVAGHVMRAVLRGDPV
jgi:proline dehydrogenase